MLREFPPFSTAMCNNIEWHWPNWRKWTITAKYIPKYHEIVKKIPRTTSPPSFHCNVRLKNADQQSENLKMKVLCEKKNIPFILLTRKYLLLMCKYSSQKMLKKDAAFIVTFNDGFYKVVAAMGKIAWFSWAPSIHENSIRLHCPLRCFSVNAIYVTRLCSVKVQ